MSSYFKSIRDSFRTLSSGLKLTLKYLSEATASRKPVGVADETYFEADKGIFTLQYPHESFPVPDTGRYRLHNEIDDCIVCDKCAKVCPVDCIDIEPIKSSETIGLTSDGTPKRIYAAKFDIDMAKCCFCGLCTTVCPTECLTMTKVYDFSEFDVRDHKYEFGEMSLVEIAQKQKEAAEVEKQKAAQKLEVEAKKSSIETTEENVSTVGEVKPKPVFRPKVKLPAAKPAPDTGEVSEEKPKPKFRPKPMIKKTVDESITDTPKSKPVMKVKPVIKKADEEPKLSGEKPVKEKPKFRPRPIIRKPKDDGDAS